MTIIVAVLCKDGAVIGADSCITLGAGDTNTIEQTGPKISIHGDGEAIIVGTGEYGHLQRFRAVADRLIKQPQNILTKAPLEVAVALAEHATSDFARTRSPMGSFGAYAAYFAGGRPCVCSFGLKAFQPELMDESIWYGSMGSGMAIVDPFLGMMRRVFWTGGQPTVSDGAFTVAWALRHAIELNTGGINEPSSIAVLRSKPIGKEKRARLLTQEEIALHEANIDGLEAHMRMYPEAQRLAAEAAVPDVPELKPAAAKSES